MRKFPNQSEQGAALLVAMVMLFMLSILGVSAMQSANVETQLAGNTLVKETTFQSAESATDAVLDVSNVLADVVCRTESNVTDMTNLNRTNNQETEASVSYGGPALASGFSISDNFAMHQFYVTGTSTVADMNTSTTIETGHIILGAASNGTEC